MFGIGFGELLFILVIILMLFGSDKIPDVAKGLAKGLAQIRYTTNEIKQEITKSVEKNNVVKDIKESINLDEIKQDLDINKETLLDINPFDNVKKEIEETAENFEDITGPIKRTSRR